MQGSRATISLHCSQTLNSRVKWALRTELGTWAGWSCFGAGRAWLAGAAKEPVLGLGASVTCCPEASPPSSALHISPHDCPLLPFFALLFPFACSSLHFPSLALSHLPQVFPAPGSVSLPFYRSCKAHDCF